MAALGPARGVRGPSLFLPCRAWGLLAFLWMERSRAKAKGGCPGWWALWGEEPGLPGGRLVVPVVSGAWEGPCCRAVCESVYVALPRVAGSPAAPPGSCSAGGGVRPHPASDFRL